MTRKLFGTDGIRGAANLHPMTAEIAMKVGMAAGHYFVRGDHRHRVVIGKDTRLSGYMIEPALVAGFTAMGMDVLLVGPMPTPAVAMLTDSMRCDLGVMISASHNPFYDNGIKLFGPDGYKLPDEVELKLEELIGSDLSSMFVAPEKLGRAKRLEDASGRYVEFAKNTFPDDLRLDGLKIVVDCANGAAYKVAPEVLWELGAEVIPVGVAPNGFNINKECGSTSTSTLSEQVIAHNADIGIALDGDADRVIICDEKGQVVDGDQIMGLVTTHMHKRGLLKGGGLVATVMSNMGLEKYLEGNGLSLERTKVGDRYVVEKMRSDGFNVGGEQSGHIVLGDYATTGDGLVAALQVLAVVIEQGKPTSQVCKLFEPYPQILKNVRYGADSYPLDEDSVKQAISTGEDRLNGSGRVLIRKSGTEPLIRVMAEGQDSQLVEQVVDDIVAAVTAVA
ncbi:phosphoglucosamine mutase [Candidatus Terasakiella magnetica]|uniref:Phosphoglucosamine mutase n=1 Tax=Candidatus Terasakiella magnetica TaxID=1867952 RepID=A0A1C3RHQ1_9PROT|nr:phosphoglucosamine mutase [Candidatus Terasakiella magnetica]SCA56808.1 phosphoglucosamine mutase [Candidatus Terasakiella magnetica]